MLCGQKASNMAAARERSSSSSSEAEADLQHFREAAWDPQGHSKKSNLPSAEPSIREKSTARWQDGHGLQTTPEFRAHVAKKLGAVLDSSITILEHMAGPAQKSRKPSEAEDDGDADFRLFSSSVPGDCGKLGSVPRGRRRLQCSSSSEQDSDQEWQRCREAAVSAADILQLSGQPAALQNSSTDHGGADAEPSRKKKRRRRRRREIEVCGEDSREEAAVEAKQDAQTGIRTVNGDGPSGKAVIVKKKKKKKTEARTDCELHP
ncbi:hypothetical protein lerEdw1_019400 [Lerista edwardsae]|nr:hypothetical protein lerEdw1_019400 [Lerista edwardsae]